MENLMAAARWVAIHTKNKFGIAEFTDQDLEDVTQAAAEGFYRGMTRKPDDPAYHWKAAKNHAIREVLRGVWGKNPHWTFELNGTIPNPTTEDDPGLPIRFAELVQFFYRRKSKKGERGMKAAKRDAYICWRLAQGAGNKAIAKELKLAEHDVRSYRVRIRRILEEALEEKTKQLICENCQKPFDPPDTTSAAKQAKYCSIQCKRHAQNKRRYERQKKGETIKVNYIETKKFIQIWYESESVAEVTEKLGLKNRNSTYSRAKYLRDKGIVLKEFSHQGSKVSKDQWSELVELSKKLGEETNGQIQ